MRKLRHREGKQIAKVRHLVRGGPKHPRPELSNHQHRLSSLDVPEVLATGDRQGQQASTT